MRRYSQVSGNTEEDNDTELALPGEEQKTDKRTTDDIAPAIAEAPPEPSPQRQPLVEKRRLEAEVVASTLIDRGNELLESEAVDILELDESE